MKKNRIKKMPIILFSLVSFLLMGCSGGKAYGDEYSEWQIQRFDTDLYNHLLRDEPIIFSETSFLFLDEFGKHVIHIGSADSVGFEERLKNYFSDSVLWNLYKDEQEKMRDITQINKELAHGMEMLSANFPSLKRPGIYMHVSGLNQNVVVSGDILSLSADKYLGADYPLYQNFFYDYQLQLMTADRIVPDYLLGFLMARFPFKGNEDVLLDKIIYEGKLRYLLSRLLPQRQVWEHVAYNKEQYQWCVDHEAKIWALILENKHLFTPNHRTTERYIQPAPFTAFLPVESPGRVGIWLGFRIVSAYMKNNPQTSFNDLMEIIDYSTFLKKSKYKP